MQSQVTDAVQAVIMSHAERSGLSFTDTQDCDCLLDAVRRAFAGDPLDVQTAAKDAAEDFIKVMQQVEGS